MVHGLADHGVAEVVEVPGEQLPALRNTVRRAIAARLGFKPRTHVVDGRLIIDCDEAFQPHAARRLQEAADALQGAWSGSSPRVVGDRGWQVHWSRWATT